MNIGVIPLKIVEPSAPDQDMVEMLEHYLNLAKKGELNFLSIIVTYKDTGAISDGYVKRDSAHRYTVIGAIEQQKHKFIYRNVV